MDRIKFIADYFYDNHTDDDFFRDSFFYLKLHALFNCLTPAQVRTLYTTHAIYSEKFKKTVLSFVGTHCQMHGVEYTLVSRELMDNYPRQQYLVQLSYRSFLSRIIQSTDDETIGMFFDLYVGSHRINDRKQAYEISKVIWNEVQDRIWENLWQFEDVDALKLLLYNAEPSQIVKNIEKIWSIKFPKDRIKKLIIDRTKGEEVHHFQFLKSLDPIYYLRALIKRNMQIEPSYLEVVVNEMKAKGNGTLFYYLGYSKDWDVLVKALNSIDTTGFSSSIFDY